MVRTAKPQISGSPEMLDAIAFPLESSVAVFAGSGVGVELPGSLPHFQWNARRSRRILDQN